MHAHYAIPHASAALLARMALEGRLKVVTTLHGTDITVVGADPSYLPMVKLAIRESDAVTAVSEYLQGRDLPDLRGGPADRRHPQLRRPPPGPAPRSAGLAGPLRRLGAHAHLQLPPGEAGAGRA